MGSYLYKIFQKMIILSLALIVMGTGLLEGINLGAGPVFENTVYAEEEEEEEDDESNEEGEDEEGKKDSTVGSSADNHMNVLGESKTTNDTYLMNLDSVLGYDKGTHYLTTLSVLNSEVMSPGSYANVYSGDYKPEGVPESVSGVDTNTAGLFDRLGRIELDEQESLEQDGIPDSVFEDIFGKEMSELSNAEQRVKDDLEEMVYDTDYRDSQKEDFDSKALTAGANYLCNTAFMASGYGGAGFAIPESYWTQEVQGGEMVFLHNIDYAEDFDKNNTNIEETSICIENLKKFDEADGDLNQTDAMKTSLLESVTENGESYTSETAESAIQSIRESSGTNAGSYEVVHDPVTTKERASDVISEIKTDNTLANIAVSIAEAYIVWLEMWNASPTVNANVHYILGNGVDDDEKYSKVGDDVRADFDNTIIPTLNEVYDRNFSRANFNISGSNGDYNINDEAYEEMNKLLTINLLTTVHYHKDVSGFQTTKENYYEEHIAPLARHNFVLFNRYESELLGSAVHESVDGLKGLGWVPFYYAAEYSDNIENTERYSNAMDDHDGTTLPGGGDRFLSNEQGPRVARVRDMVATEGGMDTMSPLMATEGEGLSTPFRSPLGRQTDTMYGPSIFSGLKLDSITGAAPKESYSSSQSAIYQEAYSSSDVLNGYTGEEAVGIDNYGNIIVGNGLSVVVPYWHVTPLDDDIYASPLYKTHGDLDAEGSNFIDTKSASGEGDYAFFDKRKNDLNTAYASTSIDTTQGIKTAIVNGEGYEGDLRRIAYRITEATEDRVKEHNEAFIDAYNSAYASGNGELYVTSASINEGETSEMDKLHDEFTEADIIHKIAMMLKYGASDFLRLTFVGFFVDFYNTTVYNFNMSEVFYSTTIVDSGFFQGLLPNITLLIGAITALYWGYSVFNMWRGRITLKRFLGVTVALTFLLVIPFLYSILIDKGMNEVSDAMLGKQTRQMMVVDSWTRDIERVSTEDSAESRLYGYNNNLEFRDSGQDYILTFATTTAVVNGCDVVNPEGLQCEEFVHQPMTDNVKTDWEQSDLVTVNVSLFDVLEWMADLEEGTTESDLFPYLQSQSDATEKGYDTLSQYTEYSVDTSVLLNDIGLGQNAFSGEVISASGLLERIHLNANENDQLTETLTGLSLVYDELLKNPEVTDEEVKYVVRDMSMTQKSREALNGGVDGFSPVTETVSQRASIGLEPPGYGINDHSGDMFNLYDSIDKLDPYRVPGYKRELEEDIYRLNKKTVESYFTDFALVREAVGANNPSYQRTEANIMSTILWFNINNHFGFDLFPKDYDGSSISLDNYMRVAYIPIGVFSDPTVSASGEYAYTNVGEYLSLRENMFNLLVFAISILFMIGYGLIKWAVIHFVLLLLTIYGFVKNYVIEYNPDNKFGFGALVVYLTFIVVNIIFNTMWWIFGYALNNSYVANDGAVGYPAVVVHSVITIAVLAFIIFFVFKKLFKNVRGDLSNMGGNNFQKDWNKFSGKMKGMMNGSMRSTENKKESAYMEESRREGGQGEITKDEVKRSNDLGERNLKSVINDESTSTSNYIMSELDDSRKISQNPDTIYSKMKGNIDTRKPKGQALANTLNEYDSIKTGGNSLISQGDKDRYDELGNFGAKLSESGTGNSISVLGFGSSANGIKQANMLQDYLTGKGVKSSVDNKGQVLFDSGKFDTSSKEGRKSMLDGFMNNVADNVNDNKSTERGNVDNNSFLSNNFDYNMIDDGKVSIGVGTESGLNPSVLASMITQDWFKDRFQVEQPYTGKGEPGNIIVKPKTESAEDVDKFTSDLFKEDTRIRDREGLEGREDKDKNNQVLRFNGDNAEVAELVQKEFARNGGDKTGANMHSNSIAFDETDREHRKMIKGIEQTLKEKHQDDTHTAEQIASKVANFTVHGQGTSDKDELDAFQRVTQKTKDGAGNVMFNISNARDEARDKTLGMVTLNGLSHAKTSDNVGKQVNASEQELSDLNNLDKEALEQNLKNKSRYTTPFSSRNTVKSDVGNQKHSADLIGQSKKSFGAGMMFGRLDTKDEKVREQIAKSGLVGDKVSTTVYGGDEFGRKIKDFNKIAEVVESNKDDVQMLSESKDKLVDVVNEKVGHIGSESRAKELIDYIGTNTGDHDFFRKANTMYSKLQEDYNSGNIESNKYKYGLKEVTKNVENLLKDQNKYDSALIHVLNKGDNDEPDKDGKESKRKLSSNDKETIENYRRSKSKLIDKEFDAKTIEKFDGKTYNKMMSFVEQGNELVVNDDDMTFDVKSDDSLSDEDTKDIYKMIRDIA